MATETRLRFIVDDEGTLKVLTQAGDELDDIGTSAKTAGDSGTSSFRAFAAQAALLTAGLVTVAKVAESVRFAIGAAAEQERNVRLLNAQLQTAGQFSTEYTKALQDQASAFQRLTGVGDETVLGVQRQLVAFGASRDNIQRVTSAVLDLSAGLGTDLNAAALLVGKALAGEFSTLSRYGIFVDENATKTEKLELALQGIERRFGGQAAANLTTYTGLTEALSGAQGDLAESFGNIVVESEPVKQLLRDLIDGTLQAADATNEWVKENREFIDLGIAATIDGVTLAVKGLLVPLQLAVAVWKEFAAAVDAVDTALGKLTPEAVQDEVVPGTGQRFPALEGPLDAIGSLIAHRLVGVTITGQTPTTIDIAARLRERGFTPEALRAAVDKIFADVPASTSADAPFSSIFGPVTGITEPLREVSSTVAEVTTETEKAKRATKSNVDEYGRLIEKVRQSKESTFELRDATAEVAEQAEAITINIGENLADGLATATQAALTRGGQNIGDVLKDSISATTSNLFGDVLRQKLDFDLTFEQNFLRDLPSMVADGASRMADAFGNALSRMTGDTRNATEQIGQSFRNVPGVGDISGVVTGTDARAQFFRDQATALGTTPEFEAALSGEGPAVQQPSEQGGGLSSTALGAITFGITTAIVGTIGAIEAANAERRRFGATSSSIREASFVGFNEAIGLGGLGRAVGPPVFSLVDQQQALVGRGFSGVTGFLQADPIFGIASVLSAANVFDAPSATSQQRKFFTQLFKEIGTGGKGVKVRDIIEDESRGGTIDPQLAALFGERAEDVSALLLSGPAADARRPDAFVERGRIAILTELTQVKLAAEDSLEVIRSLGQASGESLEEVGLRLAGLRGQGQLTDEAFTDLLAGALDSFLTLPDSIDASTLALKALDEQGNVSIKRVERLADLYTAFATTLQSGFAGAIQTGAQAAVSGTLDPREAIQTQLRGAIVSSGTDLVSGLVAESLRPEIQQFTKDLAKAIDAGDFRGIDAASDALVLAADHALNGMSGALDALAEINETITRNAAAASLGLNAAETAAGLRQEVADARRGRLSPNAQRAEINAEVQSLLAEFGVLQSGGISADEALRADEIARRLVELGGDLGGLSSQFTEGSNSFRQAHESGLQAVESAADIYDAIAAAGDQEFDLHVQRIDAEDRNTRAIEELTRVIKGGDISPADVARGADRFGGRNRLPQETNPLGNLAATPTTDYAYDPAAPFLSAEYDRRGKLISQTSLPTTTASGSGASPQYNQTVNMPITIVVDKNTRVDEATIERKVRDGMHRYVRSRQGREDIRLATR